jgi:hypothetical protein
MPTKKRIRIEVTEGDIRLGKPQFACQCPIARAVCRAMRIPLRSRRVVVCSELIDMKDEPDLRVFHLPQAARAFIRRIDSGDPVRPFVFHVTEED